MTNPTRFIAVLLLALSLSSPAWAAPRQKIGRAVLTFYWIIDESKPRYRGKADSELRTARGHLIACTTRRFRTDLVMEGTGWLKDGRTVMYDRKVDGQFRFRIARSKFGIGSLGRPLRPYRTVAVDPRLIPLGSKLYIPELKGTRLPDGTIHDGVFVASDRGHFRGLHLDVFVGAGSKAALPFARKGYVSRSHVTIYLLDPPKQASHH
ncbi:MAG: 3D domain-containing protein [Acidobacteriota bacterium]